ncbi:bifunctional phosphoribosyl-AMP cyclohydrolase/phosphoribosyl-ATP diphosphatase HisIE [Mangrovibacillus cuniculi]|uniref:Histidine biosynthesis bifunctional protein HisIE n=1 Tax=Mangrovibacillus cuniculi TaxID=2593652 RepID=A0A7S8HGW7_9BACI|nr:bifunctional phosphoribosyl-AMP cyclohydrolase/phosphoribosyl-ATP diphosphatase HisIE [Mangrovibacillus cuniculi]QPC48439.1 bifunctional phosphoribosyl-AMP cyclohydrolase/phosphoribosyl-ATP diphosphatase HisIE [Mangrovibacillus cuniculi]
MDLSKVKFDEKGLIPAIVQDAESKKVLTLAYMNEESLQKTIETKETWFWSRSRQELWHKGATSGNTQKVVTLALDCDQDALVVEVQPAGPACHTGAETCFHEEVIAGGSEKDVSFLLKLENVIKERQQTMPEGAYTTYLFEKGIDKMLKKVGEEAAEVIIGAKNRDREEVKWESADLLFHLMVVLREQGIEFSEVVDVLKERHAK